MSTVASGAGVTPAVAAVSPSPTTPAGRAQARSLLDGQRQRALAELDKAAEAIELAKAILGRVDARRLKNVDIGTTSRAVFAASAMTADAALFRAGIAPTLKRLAIICEIEAVDSELCRLAEEDDLVEQLAAWSEAYLDNAADAKDDHLRAEALEADPIDDDAGSDVATT